uniref:Uncharacterized protein n=1 Tax=Alexandrium catenella TaxID=2925 RepID=A0A7S1WLC0_ALECA
MISDLLSQVRAEVASDLASDTQVYNNMEQWCATTIPQMQASLAQSLDRDRELVTTIETSTQSVAQLQAQTSSLEAELAKETTSLQQHAKMREREAREFHESEKELLLSTQKLSQAIGILQSHYDRSKQPELNATAERERLEAARQGIYAGTGLENGTGTPSQDGAALIRVAADVQQALRSLPAGEMRVAAASAEASEALQGFFANPQELLLRSVYGSRASLTEVASTLAGAGTDSRQVFGVLQQLLQTFQEDLQALRLKEQQDSSTAKSLAETKTAQIMALEASLASKKAQLAQHSATNADAKTDLAYLRQSREADTQRLLDVQQSCLETKQEFQVRNATRHSELQSLDEAIAILATDSSGSGSGSSKPRGQRSSAQGEPAG